MTIPLMPQNKLLRMVLIVIATALVFIFLPFVLGGGLIYLLYKKLPSNKVRNALILILGILTLLIGSAWTMGAISDPPKPAKNPGTQEASPSAKEEVKAASTEAKLVNGPYQITKVIDGDTVSVDIGGKQEVVRVIGVDTPESVDPRKPAQCFAQEASRMAKIYFEDSKTIQLESDPSQGDNDKYGRLLRYIFTDDGSVDYGKVMISLGYAHEYTYNIPYKYQTKYKEAEKEARENKKGLWADDACLIVPTTQTKTQTIITSPPSNTKYSCAGKTTCGQMTSCAEASFYLNNCGVSRLDGDKDGTPCETLCN